MACSTCGQSQGCGCDTSCFGGTSNWLIPVNEVPPIEMASRKFAYITPDEIVWVANHAGTEMIKVNDDTPDIIDASESLPPLDEAELLKLYRQDDHLLMVNSARTDWITVI